MKAVYFFLLLLFSQYCKHKASKMLDFLKVMYRSENSKVLSDAPSPIMLLRSEIAEYWK